MDIDKVFLHFSDLTAREVGRPIVFAAAAMLIAAWLVLGPLFHFSDTWQLVVNTATSVITLLIVFLIQATQNRDTAAIHVKLDELIRANAAARNELIDVELLDEAALAKIREHFDALARRAASPSKDDFADPMFADAVARALKKE